MSKIFKRPEDARSFGPYERASIVEPETPEAAAESEAEAEPEDMGPTPEEVLAEARATAEAKVQEAYEEGLRRGEAAGLEQFQREVGKAAESLAVAAGAIQNAREQFISSLEPQVVELAQLVAERVLRREAATDPELIKRTARAALSELFEQERVHLVVNPQDAAVLREHQADLLAEFDGIAHLDVQEDPSIDPGGCIAQTETLFVDARLQTQLQRIVDEMLE